MISPPIQRNYRGYHLPTTLAVAAMAAIEGEVYPSIRRIACGESVATGNVELDLYPDRPATPQDHLALSTMSNRLQFLLDGEPAMTQIISDSRTDRPLECKRGSFVYWRKEIWSPMTEPRQPPRYPASNQPNPPPILIPMPVGPYHAPDWMRYQALGTSIQEIYPCTRGIAFGVAEDGCIIIDIYMDHEPDDADDECREGIDCLIDSDFGFVEEEWPDYQISLLHAPEDVLVLQRGVWIYRRREYDPIV
ncbi:MAG: hypothetical protein Alpg2KO_02810 [Alphaproteobacteria bacterium]